MSQHLCNIIQIAVRQCAGQPAREQLRILQDCDAVAPDHLRPELKRLTLQVQTTERMLRTYCAQSDADQI